MYFPYVRGRLYELLALRELVEKDLLSSHILPVIEPVKLSSTLTKTMESYNEKSIKLGIVCNPTVGSFNNDVSNDDVEPNKLKFESLLNDSNIIKSHIMKKDSEITLATWNQFKNLTNSDWLVISNDRDCIDI